MAANRPFASEQSTKEPLFTDNGVVVRRARFGPVEAGIQK